MVSMAVMGFSKKKGEKLKLRANGCDYSQHAGSFFRCLQVAKSLISLKLCTTTPKTRKNMQQGVQKDATCNIQHC